MNATPPSPPKTLTQPDPDGLILMSDDSAPAHVVASLSRKVAELKLKHGGWERNLSGLSLGFADTALAMAGLPVELAAKDRLNAELKFEMALIEDLLTDALEDLAELKMNPSGWEMNFSGPALGFADPADPLSGSFEQLTGSSEQLTVSSEQLSGSSEQLSGSSEQLSESSEQLSVSSEQLSGSSEQLTGSSEQLPESSEQLSVSSEQLSVWLGQRIATPEAACPAAAAASRPDKTLHPRTR